MTVTMHLDTAYFNAIKNKTKQYETRVFDNKRQKLRLLEEISLLDRESERMFKAKIIELAWFPNFKTAITPVGFKNIMHGALSLDEAVATYESFPHSSEGNYKRGAQKYGVLRIKFALLK